MLSLQNAPILWQVSIVSVPTGQHKCECKKGAKWYDCHRLCKDGSERDLSSSLGNVLPTVRAGAMFSSKKKIFTKEFEGDLKFFDHWPQAFRWQCCVMDGNMAWVRPSWYWSQALYMRILQRVILMYKTGWESRSLMIFTLSKVQKGWAWPCLEDLIPVK
ncbi:hypothetical protein DFS33DRAFT_1274171 [Desarmillaria ectypa]|nr:hypothetical protein DFS33DRAFT_1274171 [Desarmillaria ectypa]